MCATVAAAHPVEEFAITPDCRPWFSAIVILATDIVGLSLVLWLFLSGTWIADANLASLGLRGALLIPPFLVLFWLFDSYPGVGKDPVQEIRNICLATGCGFFFLAAVFAFHQELLLSLVCLPLWVVCSVVILSLRAAVRLIVARRGWWGVPVVVIGSGQPALSVMRSLMNRPTLGYTPVALVSDDLADGEAENVRVFNTAQLPQLASSGISHAIIAISGSRSEITDTIGHLFSKVIFIPDGNLLRRDEPLNLDLAGIRGVDLQDDLHHAPSRFFKRALDVVFSSTLLLLLLPVIAFITIAVAIESGFPILYFDKRIGYRGKVFHMWKFRTMVKDASTVLQRYLDSDDELRKEWAQYQKLRKDPRVTWIGRLLRKTSLDEIPQLWNVFRGDMSMVGPRPRLLEVNVPRYEKVNALYARVAPGLTGLWQVSGRNRTTYEERLAYDDYYIRNWSPWMDIYLLVRTVSVVITGYGAY